MDRIAFSVAEFCKRNAVGRTFAYKEIKARRLQALKAGRRTLITAKAEGQWLANLPSMAAEQQRDGDEADV